jgi:TatD DNase family protein
MRNKNFKGLIHCFTAKRNLAYKVLDLGFYISLSGVITFKNSSDLQEIVTDLPLESLLIETDAPYLAPAPMRGQKNEPAYVTYVAEKLAILKNVSIEKIAEQTSNNFVKLFDKAFS